MDWGESCAIVAALGGQADDTAEVSTVPGSRSRWTRPSRSTATRSCISTAEGPRELSQAVADCRPGAEGLRQHDLASDLPATPTHLCPRCRAALTDSIRGHLYACARLPRPVRIR